MKNSRFLLVFLSVAILTAFAFMWSAKARNGTSSGYFVQYSFTVEDVGRQSLFSNSTKDSFNPLIAVQDRFSDVKLPLPALSTDPVNSGIEIREANSLAKLLPYQVTRFLQ